MKTNEIKFLLSLGLATFYTVFFWESRRGVNVLVFSMLLLAALYACYRASFKASAVRWLAGAVLLTGGAVVWHASLFSKWMHLISLIGFVGMVHQPRLRAVYGAFGAALESALLSVVNYLEAWQQTGGRWVPRPGRLGYGVRLALIPVLLLVTFYLIYTQANPKFAYVSASVWGEIGTWFATISWGRLLFFLTGLLLTTGALFNRQLHHWLKRDAASDYLMRRRKKRLFSTGMTGLREEYRMALGVLILLNTLLLAVNTIDVYWVWFTFDYHDVRNLSQFVHEGTYLLIVSILLAMGVVLWFFRGNLNFFRHNRMLKAAAAVWIVQNAILALSVGVRNYHYIHEHALAYKRLGVIAFLVLVLFGLYTIWMKINEARSSAYLWRVNGWASLGLLVTISLLNWDGIIVRYNMTHSKPNELDMEYLFTFSDKTLPILADHADLLQTDRYEYHEGVALNEPQRLQMRVQDFLNEYETRRWWEWNRADAQAYRQLGRLE
ncbi:protein of unknown function [Catalinimonas alkaloidigena]|uniref:Uncharacterized protein n=1 Tax=Catalinimonas alkaloidigena TaxID=1075417 RepID=A0A1G9PBP0_9BACT|nr:DUF4173 domain-containing protein [Catalinimonas alkaloidigena]SDL95637.1 protein of unknown function [Catalinimonas alkaloidigena]